AQHAGRHHQRSRARPATGLVDAGDGTEAPPGQRGLEGQPTVPAGHTHPAGQQPVPGPLRPGPGHPAEMSGEGTDPILLSGRMTARTLPMMLSPGTVPWNSSPMWKRESAELPRLSP